MRKLIEYTLISADGVVENPQSWAAMSTRDDTYLRDGLGLLHACDAMLMGRGTYEIMYEISARIWPSRMDAWADRLNAMPKYVFSSTLQKAAWNNTRIVRGDAVAQVEELKRSEGRDLLIWGHGLLAGTLFKHRLIDVLDLSIHPVILGQGKQVFGEKAQLRLVATKAFCQIVKLTFEPQY
jgi:dihydrofolate reductase